jgi:hypothetical protein
MAAGWVRCTRGRLIYTGRLGRAPFTEWIKTDEGQAAVNRAAARIRFSLLGKTRAAARRLWRQVTDMARDTAAAAVIEREVQEYLPRLGSLVFADGLPRTGVDLRRLVVVPNVLLNGGASAAISRKLKQEPAFASLDGGEALKEFFITAVVSEADAAVAGARPSPRSPLDADAGWTTVGVNRSFVWRVPVFQAPPWNGHHYVLELTREPITRAVRKAVAQRIEQFEASLPALSRTERGEILRRAREAA